MGRMRGFRRIETESRGGGVGEGVVVVVGRWS